MKNRLPYIDQLKGFAILTVVIGHFIQFCLHNIDNSLTYKLIYSFHMPLFAFLSGLMFRSFNDIKSIGKKFLSQSYKLLLPFVSFGIIYMYTIRSGQDFITNYWKLGVWYLLFLWQCYLLTHGYHWLTEKIGRSSSVRLLVDACWLLLTMVVFRSLWMELSQVLTDTFGIGHLFELYPFFFIGYVIKRTATFERWFGANELLFDVSIILWLLFFCLPIIGYQFKGPLGLMMGIPAVYFVVALFYRSHVRGGGEFSHIENLGNLRKGQSGNLCPALFFDLHF